MSHAIPQTESNERTVAILARLLPWTSLMFPGLNIIAPAVMLLFSESDFSREHIIDELNMQFFWSLMSVALMFGTCGLFSLLVVPLWVVYAVFEIQAVIAASKGERYRYPGTPQLFG